MGGEGAGQGVGDRVECGPEAEVFGAGELVRRPVTDFGSSRSRGFVEGQAGAGYEAVEGVRPVLKACEPASDKGFEPVEGDDGGVGQAALDVCPYPLDRVEIGRVGRQQEHRQTDPDAPASSSPSPPATPARPISSRCENFRPKEKTTSSSRAPVDWILILSRGRGGAGAGAWGTQGPFM